MDSVFLTSRKLQRTIIPPKSVRSTVMGSSALPKLSPSSDPQRRGSMSRPHNMNLPSLAKSRRKSEVNPMAPYMSNADYRITICILENWGHPSLITTSAIEVLNKKHIPIPIDSIVPKNPKHNNGLLSKLSNNEFNKACIDDAWSEKWTPGQSITFTYFVQSPVPPDAIRIWNGSFEPLAGIKQIQVYCGKYLILDAEIPQQFGKVLPLQNEYFLSYPIYDPEVHDIVVPKFEYHDRFGIAPIKEFRIITIESFEPFAESEINPNVTGINTVEFYDYSGTKIDTDQVNQVFIGEGNGVSDLSSVLTYHEPKVEENEMLVGLRSVEGYFRISFVFNKPVPIGCLKIYNYDGNLYGSEIGMKKVKIYADGKVVHLGGLKRAYNPRTASEIWFADAGMLYKMTHDDEKPDELKKE